MAQVMSSQTNIARAVRLILGGLLGAGIGYQVGKLLKVIGPPSDAFTWSDIGALVIGGLLLAVGAFMGLASLSRRLAGRLLDPAAERPITPAQATFYRQQSVVLLLAGPMMAAPVITQLLQDPVPPMLGAAVFCGVAALFLVQTVYNMIVWRRGDELIRQITTEASAISFWILQGALFFWAAAEKLDLAPPVSTWDSVTILMAVYLLVAGVVSARRGYR